MNQKIVNFWLHHVHLPLTTLIATIGIVGIVSCLFILFIVAELASEVIEKEAFVFDTSFLLWLHQFANPTLDNLMLFITNLGNPNIVAILASVTFLILLWRRYLQEAPFFGISCLGSLLLYSQLKLFFAKSRPTLWEQLISVKTFSFPSGHALCSLVLYGFIAYLLASHYPNLSKIIYPLAVILIAMIGISRLYLGVHWPTDIIAGYGVGYLWLMICITMLKLQKSRLNDL